MLSTSIETQVRGDEGNVCGQLAQYRSVRVPRSTGEDVEMLKTPEMANVRKRLHQKFGRYQQEDEEPQQAEEGEFVVEVFDCKVLQSSHSFQPMSARTNIVIDSYLKLPLENDSVNF